MRKVTRKYKGWTISEGAEQSADGIIHPIFRCYSPEQMSYPKFLRLPDWDACDMTEATEYIDTHAAE